MTTKQSMRPTKTVPRGSSADSAQQHPKPPFPAQHQTSPGLESKLKPRPQYQAHAHVPKSPSHSVGRGVPDVAGDADPATGYQIFLNGVVTTIGFSMVMSL